MREFEIKVYRFIALMVLLVAVYSLIFVALMLNEGHPEFANPIIAIYWVIVTMTTVGYGDIVFRSPAGHLFSSFVSLSGITILFAVALPMMVTPWVERISRELPTGISRNAKDHIIICGYSPIVETLVEKLVSMAIPFVIIERREDTARSIYRKYPTVWGDPSDRVVILNANIHQAKMLIANESDELNADVILTAREISGVETLALVEDLNRSRFLSYAGASRVVSPKTLLGTFLAQIASPPREGVFPGAVQLFGNIWLVELPVYPGSDLVGRRLSDHVIQETGVKIVGMWQRGRYCPVPEEEVVANSVILAVGDLDHLSLLRDRTVQPLGQGQFLVVGYGDVGRRVVRVLCDWGISPTVVDRRDLADHGFRNIQGDGSSENVLIEAGVKEAKGILIMLNRDQDVIYTTLIARNLNPAAFIVARANHASAVEKIYRAGADYVASVPLVASHMLFKMVRDEGEGLTILFEGLELKRHEVPKRSAIAGRSIREAEIRRRCGCTVVAIERSGVINYKVTPDTLIRTGDVLAVLGSPSEIDLFSRLVRRRWIGLGRIINWMLDQD